MQGVGTINEPEIESLLDAETADPLVLGFSAFGTMGKIAIVYEQLS